MEQQDGAVRHGRSLLVRSVADEGSGRGYHKWVLATDRGAIRARYYPAAGGAAVIWAGGVGGGFDSPARGFYGDLARDLVQHRISSLWLSYRHPGELGESVLDVMAGVALLETLGLQRLGLVGYSFGGAVAIQVGARCESVRTLVALASQASGADAVDQLSPRSLLLVHGEEDRTLLPHCSASLYARALEPKRLVLLPGAGHDLVGARERLRGEVALWLTSWLGEKHGPNGRNGHS